MTSIQEITDLLNEISEDGNSTKNLKLKIQQIVTLLSADESLSMRLNKASQALDDLASNGDIDSYTRTQLMGIVSALETVEE